MDNILTFLLGYLRNPKRVGAVLPASTRLAKFISKHIREKSKPQFTIVEVGCGTGALTDELIKLDKDLTVLEQDIKYVDIIVKKYPELKNISHTSAVNLNLLFFLHGKQYVLVSSLPFASLPKIEAKECIEQLLDFLNIHKDSYILQYTYKFPCFVPFEVPYNFKWQRVGVIWGNLPPATIWRLEKVYK